VEGQAILDVKPTAIVETGALVSGGVRLPKQHFLAHLFKNNVLQALIVQMKKIVIFPLELPVTGSPIYVSYHKGGLCHDERIPDNTQHRRYELCILRGAG
jgi:hypothetical protein